MKNRKIAQNMFMYFNYHAKAKRLILEGKLEGYQFVDEYHEISPALVLYFKDSPPMPIRKYRWEEYLPFIINFDKNRL